MTNIVQNGGDSIEVTHSENGDSTSSELERLENASPCPSGADSPTERGIAKTKKQEDYILKIIEQASALGSNTVDLSNKGLRQFPSELLEMPQLEYLYMEGNELTTVPDEMFDKLPNLKWLDLRRNYLVRLPSIYTGRHQNLRNLLLEGNNLRTLPLELGLVRSLHGLNINNNPLEFPPPSIIEKGTIEILKFLREMIQAKSAGKLLSGGKLRRVQSLDSHRKRRDLPDLMSGAARQQSASVARCKTGYRRGSASGIKAHSAKLASHQFPLESESQPDIKEEIQEDLNEGSSSSDDDDDWDEDGGDLRQYAIRQLQQRSLSTKAASRAEQQIRPMNKSAELHRPVTFTEVKQSKAEKIRKAGAMGTFEKKLRNKRVVSKSMEAGTFSKGSKKPSTANSVMNWKVNPYPEPPGQDYLEFKMKEERQVAKVKELKEKTDAILQRRKDEEMLKGWRDETKRLKQKKYFESLQKGTKDFLDPATQAPYDIDKDYLRMQTNEERIKQDVKSAHEKLRSTMSPASRQRMEEEKAQRILQLEKRIKDHTTQMHDRRKMPKGTPQEEMEAARRELEVVKTLQKDLLRRYQELKAWSTG